MITITKRKSATDCGRTKGGRFARQEKKHAKLRELFQFLKARLADGIRSTAAAKSIGCTVNTANEYLHGMAELGLVERLPNTQTWVLAEAKQ